MADFVHLHLHTLYSLLDGAIRMKDLVQTINEKKMSTVAVTDHGNMFGAVDFYKKAKAAGIKPIMGCEAYVAGPRGRKDRSERVSNHLVLLAENQVGWKNLRYLVSMGYTEGHYYHPRLDKDLLRKHSEGIIALTACLGGEVPGLARRGDMDGARNAALEYKDIFGPDRFFLEIQCNGLPEQEKANAELKQLSRDLDIPLAATADAHYVKREDAKAHELLMCIAQGKLYDDPKRMRHDTSELYIKSPDEMMAHFSDVPEAVANTVRIGEMCNVELELGNVFLPNFQVPDGHDNDSFLAHLARTGLDRRFSEICSKYPVDRDAYRERLEMEIDVIVKMGFSGYFLIVQDFINWAKEHGIPVGPGRGSGAGSIVAYALRITDLDPIPYALLFERFLNPERVSMPDFDVDFCQNRRGEVIDYVTQKYGETQVGQIITFGQLSAKSAIKDVGRVLGLSFGECNELTKNIPALIDGKPPTIKKAIELDPKLQERIDSDERVKEVMRIAEALEGLNRQAGMHAAGVVIADKPLWEYVPLYQPSGEKFLVTQFAKDEVEEAGLVKFDFLGLKTLTVIRDAIDMINANNPGQEKIFEEMIPLDDPATYQMIAKGDTQGVFQLESSGFTELLKKLKPDRFEDIVAAVALYRPGPLQSGMVDDFIERKHGRQAVSYPHPDLESILQPTYGVIVYQEQVMQISQVLGGYSLGRADLLRRAMGKKKAEVMAKERAGFMEGADKTGVDPKLAGEIFDLMEKFAAYGFNKCVVGSTEVLDARTGAKVEVSTLFEKRPQDFETLSLHEASGRMVARKVTDVMQNGVKPVFALNTALGKRVVATGNHPFLTKRGWKWLEELQVGEQIATPRRLPIPNETTWPKSQLVALAALLTGSVQREGTTATIRMASAALAADLGQTVHRFPLTQGRVHENEVQIAAPQPYAAEGGAARWQQPQESSCFVAWAEALGLFDPAQRLPQEVFTLRDTDLELLLGRIWSAAGTLSSTPSLKVSTEATARDLQHLLLRLGIVAQIGASQRGWKVRIADGESLERFHHRIAPHLVGRDGERQALLEAILARTATGEQRGDVYWDEVVSIEPRGEEMTYDLTVDETHNFVADGVIVHNSHSAAYALVTMQTAWLKCHYPAEFMAALLTSDADKTEKLVAHIADARDRGLDVQPPDVNESLRSFRGVPGQIRFGLGGVKGVGTNAIEAILEARTRDDEPFAGLYDFCERVDLRRVNRKVIECLVRCGAFDFTGIERWKLFAAIEKALERGQSAQRDKAIGQSSLFGLLGGADAGAAKEKGPGKDGEYPEVDPWTDKEKLTGERETMGFYITGHPLDPYADEIKRYTTHTTAQVVAGGKNGEQVRIVGVTAALRARPTKTGKLMGFATMEDLTGTIECICFAGGRRGRPGDGRPERSGGFEQWQSLLETDAPLLISGTVQMNTRDEENPVAEIIVDDVVPLAEMRARRASRLSVTLPVEQVTPDKLARMKGLLAQHPGALAVEVRVLVPGASVTKIVVRDCKVTPTDDLRERLNLLFGGQVVGVD